MAVRRLCGARFHDRRRWRNRRPRSFVRARRLSEQVPSLFRREKKKPGRTDRGRNYRSTASPRLRRLALLALVGANLVWTALGLVASSQNYPGLAAVTFLRSHLTSTSASEPATATTVGQVNVHVGIEAKMTGASNFVLLDQPAQARARRPQGDAAPQAWYLPSLSPASSSTTPDVVFSRVESPAYETLEGLARSGEFDYALVSATAADDAASAPVGTETLYEAPVFAGFDWRAVVLRGKAGEFVRTKPAVRVVKLPRSDRA